MSGRGIGCWVLAVVAVFAFAGCGGDGGGSSGAGSTTGTLAVAMTDATLPGFQAIYVSIDEVQAHGPGGWVTVKKTRKTVDLLTLVNGVREELGIARLDSGHYTQLRLLLAPRPFPGLNLFSQPHPHANYFIDDSGDLQELKVPSGLQTGIKIVNGFRINADETTELLLDFDAARSVVKAGSSGQWLLKPTIKVLDTADYVIVSGRVTDEAKDPEASDAGVAGVVVSAQTDSLSPDIDPRDEVEVHAATVTNSKGYYKLFLAPGSYNLVAFRAAADTAYGPGCNALVDLPADSLVSSDFVLAATDQIGSIAGEVTIADPLEDQHATLSVRRTALCGADSRNIEVAARNVAAGGSYSLPLPAQTYHVVGWTFGRPTRVVDGVTVVDGAATAVDFAF